MISTVGVGCGFPSGKSLRHLRVGHGARPVGLADALGAVLVADPLVASAAPLVAGRLVGRGPRRGALAACEARRSFDPGRLVPLDAFLYRRVVESVWTRYRQEWSFGRRCRPAAAFTEHPAAESDRPDPEVVNRLASILGNLGESDRGLVRRLFWDGRSEDELAFELGVSRQAVNKRKQKLLQRLRSELILAEERLGVGTSNSDVASGANTTPRTAS